VQDKTLFNRQTFAPPLGPCRASLMRVLKLIFDGRRKGRWFFRSATLICSA